MRLYLSFCLPHRESGQGKRHIDRQWKQYELTFIKVTLPVLDIKEVQELFWLQQFDEISIKASFFYNKLGSVSL